MAPRTRATRSRAAPKATSSSKPTQRQSSLTFNNNRITKPANGSLSAQEKKVKATADAKAVKLLEDETPAAIKVELEQEPASQAAPKEEPKAEAKAEVKAEAEDDITDDEQTPVSHTATAKPIPIRSQLASSPEVQARKISEAQIKRYWRAKEAERKTPRVHQQGLSLYEKVLREFDVSYQYGPCIGITRMKRWMRARNLDLDPPIEVLAVLLKSASAEDTSGDGGGRAYIDILASARLGIVAQ